MMKKIYKYPLSPPVGDKHVVKITMPFGAEVLTVQTQLDSPMIWALINPKAKQVEREFVVVGTGFEFEHNEDMKYVGTFQLASGVLVFHLFEKVDEWTMD